MVKKWYERDDNNRIPGKVQSKKIVQGLWTKCPQCGAMVYNEDLQQNYYVCPSCKHHFLLNAYERINILLDKNSFQEIDRNIMSSDPLGFSDTHITYQEKINQTIKKSKLNEAVITGTGKINKKKVCIAVLDFKFFGGSMGSVVGEKITRLIEKAIFIKAPVIIVSSSGGARMQEGIFSLMQMAKTSSALGLLSKKNIPYISILTHPTTGGVTASFAMLGDVIIAEPNALIGFAGPRVIEQTIKQKLPRGFQRSEFLLEHGLIDMVIPRNELKNTTGQLLNYMS